MRGWGNRILDKPCSLERAKSKRRRERIRLESLDGSLQERGQTGESCGSDIRAHIRIIPHFVEPDTHADQMSALGDCHVVGNGVQVSCRTHGIARSYGR